MIGTIAINKIKQEEAKLVELAQKMWDCPEAAYNEVNACAWTAELLKEYGFDESRIKEIVDTLVAARPEVRQAGEAMERLNRSSAHMRSM